MKTSTYKEQMERCSITIVLRAVVDAEGNQSKAAQALGVHRNTVRLELRKHGYNFERVQQLTMKHNPVMHAKLEMRRRRREHKLFKTNADLLKKSVQSIGLEVLFGERRFA